MTSVVLPSTPINGWINLDKPVGMSSAAAVSRVKRALRPEKIGHAGTLDPLASGILPLALGEACKTVQYMMDAAKAYEFSVTWGQERDTDDEAGEVTATSENRPNLEQITAIVPEFIGDISQAPPSYSAIKLGGKRAYDLARAGKPLEIKPRQVFVKSLEIASLTPNSQILTTRFLCHCGKGTYIRSLARDMGRKLGCYGYISALRRVEVGKFDEASAISLEMLENMVHKGSLDFLQSVESSLDDILAWELNSTQATDLRHGKKIFVPELSSHNEKIILAKYNKNPWAMCELEAGVMKPLRVFNL
jgi:tRNA pseudouridine55 synthase